MTEFVTAETVQDLRELAPTGRLLAGGTDLLVQMRAGRIVDRLIDVSNLRDGPPVIGFNDGRVQISALAPLGLVGEALDGRLPALEASFRLFASIQIRNRATIGGNLANASPAGDTIPPLVAAGALAILNSDAGTRRLPVSELITGPGKTVLRSGEWIETIEVPFFSGDEGFRKLGGRQAMAISVVSLAWRWRQDADGHLHDVALACGAVAPTVVRLGETEAQLEDQHLDETTIGRAEAALKSEISPIDDLRAGASYRREAAGALLREALMTISHRGTKVGEETSWR